MGADDLPFAGLLDVHQRGAPARYDRCAAAYIIFGVLNEPAIIVAHAADQARARREVSRVVDHVMAGIRAGGA
jgi:hypothetical protein